MPSIRRDISLDAPPDAFRDAVAEFGTMLPHEAAAYLLDQMDHAAPAMQIAPGRRRS